MNIRKQIERRANYRQWSERAAQCERQGDYKTAAECWQKAERFAEKGNVDWAAKRVEYCQWQVAPKRIYRFD
ncbi:hypothetical protein A4G18_07345 [Pasteurellaceae bacterium Pebbles2]|nr:hypothetical protein [Pasteurellaceae bacterium Pebbles2]